MPVGLEGLKVIEMGQMVAVPMASRLLGDFGADVIHIEHPIRGDTGRTVQTAAARRVGLPVEDIVPYIWEHYNRNKRGMTLDVSQEEGQQLLYKMVGTADVFLTNMRPFEIERYHLDYKTLSKLNPRLIYASLTGLGKNGADKNVPSYDHTIYWARAGFSHRLAAKGMAISGQVGAFGDNIAAMVMAYGIMTALYIRETTGVGQEVDISLLNTGIYHDSWDVTGALITGRDIQMPDWSESGALLTCYQTKDGRWLRVGFVLPDRYWARFCQAIGREDLENDPRFDSTQTKAQNNAALLDILKDVFKGKTLAEWKERLGNDIPWAPVQTIPEVCQDPQARQNGAFIQYDHPSYGPMELVANPVMLSKTPSGVNMPAPEFSQHTEEILLDYGYTWEDIAGFKEKGVIA
ncbi:CaiB/BaiF CoA transferase family protein [Chloroflexota bacterium]